MVKTKDSFLFHTKKGKKPLVATFGLNDILVVVDEDVILVSAKSQAPYLKKLVSELRKGDYKDYL